MNLIIALVGFTLSQAETAKLVCDYTIMGITFSSVELGFLPNGEPEDFVTVSMQGKEHRESYTPVNAAEGEAFHGWISQESSENSIEMIVYRESQKAGNSKLVNSRVPFGKEVWGNCVTNFSWHWEAQ
jgi:hypothetical protein